MDEDDPLTGGHERHDVYRHPETLMNTTPQWIMDPLLIILNTIRRNGFIILIVSISMSVVWFYLLSPWIKKYKKTNAKRRQDQDSCTLVRIRERQQAKLSEEALLRKKKAEEEGKGEGEGEEKRHDRPMLNRDHITTAKGKRPKRRNDDYNPLLGPSGNSLRFQPSRPTRKHGG